MKKIIISLILLCAFVVCGYFGYRGYIKWRQVQLVKQARVFLEKSDSRNAYLCLQRAIQANPFDIEACRLMAELAEASRSPAALMWRSRVVELSPNSVSDRLDLAKVALVMRDYAAATNALDGVSEDGKKTAEFHNIAGAVASVTGPAGEAQRHFAEAVRISPTNVYAQINLAVVQLRQTNATSLAAGRTALNTLRNHPEIGNMALRELILDAVRHKQLPNALAMSDDLLKKTNAVFADRLLRLSILHELKNSDLANAIAACQRDAVTNPAHLHELVIWQINSGMSADALRWMQSLPIDVQTNQPAALLAADCYSMQNNWAGLQTFLSTHQWGDIDFLRRAYLARSLRQQQMSTASKAEWEGAVKAAGGQRVRLRSLLNLTDAWRWGTEAEELLWSFVNLFPADKWAFRRLADTFYSTHRTRSLLTLYTRWAEVEPKSISVKNNLAMSALLLDAQEKRPHDLALEAYKTAPTNANFATTYALSLHLQNKSADALKILDQLQPDSFKDPSIAAYYAFLLKANGNAEKAKSYQDVAAKAPLLPEEKKIFQGL